MDLREVIDYLKDKPNFDKLNFVNEEWIEANMEAPWATNLFREAMRFHVCEDCKNNSDRHLDETVCPEALPIINADSSNFYRKIIISDQDCPAFNSFSLKQKNKELMINSGLTEVMQEKTLKNFDVYMKDLRDAHTKCVYYVDNFLDFYKKGIGLYLYSKNPGNGKSHLSIATAMDVFRKHDILPKYCNLVELINTYKSKLNKDFAAFSIVPEVYLHEGLLIIDDIGTEVGTARSGEIAYAIVHYRYDHNLPTLFTSNYSLSQLVDRYNGDDGSKIVDRIRGRCPDIQLTAPSYRSKELDKLMNM